MKKKILLVISLVLVVLLSTVALFACKKATKIEEEVYKIIKPTELPKHELGIEWVVPLEDNKPIAILFHGHSEHGKKEAACLEKDVYIQNGKDIFGDKAIESLNINAETEYIDLVKFWKNAGFSLGIFHYESFADEYDSKGQLVDFSSKIFDKTKNTFKYKNGEKIEEKQVDFNLVEAFYSVYKQDVAEKQLLSKAIIRPNEVRFIGHKVGSNLAVAATDYLYEKHAKGYIDAKYLPNRLALLNPYLSNKLALDVSIDYQEDARLVSLLSYNERTITKLSKKGVLFEMYQSNPKHYLSYGEDNIYHGVTKSDNSGVIEYKWEEGTDTNAYDNIVRTVAYLNFRENVSQAFFPDNYLKLDKIILDWYLYSVDGSDDKSSTYKLENGETPIYDTSTHKLWNKDNSIKYGMSAWVSTVYLKLMQGHKYDMIRFEPGYSGSPDKANPYTMTRFHSAIYQMSDFKLKEGGFFVAGFVYECVDNSKFVNLSYGAGIKGVRVVVGITKQNNASGEPSFYYGETDEHGFYKVDIPEHYLMADSNSDSYTLDFSIEVDKPNYKQFVNKSLSGINNKLYSQIDVSSINRPTSDAGSDTVALSVNEEHNYYLIVKNCGLIKSEE